MNTINFWSQWNKSSKAILFVLFALFFASFVLFAVSWFIGGSTVMPTGNATEIDPINITIDKFENNLSAYEVNTPNYLTKNRITTLSISPKAIYSYVYLFFILASIVVLLTIITYLNLWYYLGSITIFLIFLAFLQTELLEVFGLTGKKFLAGLLILYIGITYYLKSASQYSFVTRLVIFTTVTAVVFGCIQFFSLPEIDNPLLFVSSFGIAVPLCIAILFFFLTGFDILKGFLYLTAGNRSATNKSSFLNFLFISLLYITCVILTYLKKADRIEWDIITIPPLLLFAITTLLGLWAYRKKEILYKDIFPFAPYGAYYYLALATITSATIAYALITGNDPMVDAIEFGILYSYLCSAIVFVIYIVINFGSLAETKLNIFNVVYRPNSMPFFMVRGISFVGMIALFVLSGKMPYKFADAGYHNNVGDAYFLDNEKEMAKQYYFIGFTAVNLNYRSNYALATIYQNEKNIGEAVTYYGRSLNRHTTVNSYLGLGNIYYENDQWFNALFALKDGLKDFPESGELYNNIGAMYLKLNTNDSAYYYLNKAHQLIGTKNSAPATNLIYLLSRKGLIEEVKPFINDDFNKDQPYATNLATYQNLIGVKQNIKASEIRPAKLNNENFYLYHNLFIQQMENGDTTLVSGNLEYIKDSTLTSVHDNLKYLNALFFYYNGKPREGIELMINLSSLSDPIYTRTLSAWYSKMGLHDQAALRYAKAMTFGDQNDALYFCIESLESGLETNIDEVLAELLKSQRKEIRTKAMELQNVVNATTTTVSTLTDREKYLFLHFNLTELKESEAISISNSISDANLAVMSKAELMKFYLAQSNHEKAAEIWSTLGQFENKINDYSIGYSHFQYLQLLKQQSKWQQLEDELKDIYLLPNHQRYIPYFHATAQAGKGDSLLAQSTYKQAAIQNPFDEQVLTDAVNYINKTGDYSWGYNILIDAIQYNTESAVLLKAYIEQALLMNLPGYAESVINELQGKISNEEMKQLKTKIQQANLE